MQQFREQLVLSIGTKLAVFVYHSQVLSGAGHRQKLRKFIEILETFGGKAMWQRNNGQAEDDLQFRFTAYLVSAVKRRRKDYLIQLYKRSSIESSSEVVYESEPSSEEVVLDKLPLMDVIENGALLEALQKLNERERQIFLARTLEEEDFETYPKPLYDTPIVKESECDNRNDKRQHQKKNQHNQRRQQGYLECHHHTGRTIFYKCS